METIVQFLQRGDAFMARGQRHIVMHPIRDGHEKQVLVIGKREDGQYFEAVKRWIEATPEQRAQWEREAAEKRAEYRKAHGLLSDTDADIIEGVAQHFAYAGEHWTPAYIRHLAQPYCSCEWDQDGCWNLCQHAVDLGFSS